MKTESAKHSPDTHLKDNLHVLTGHIDNNTSKKINQLIRRIKHLLPLLQARLAIYNSLVLLLFDYTVISYIQFIQRTIYLSFSVRLELLNHWTETVL